MPIPQPQPNETREDYAIRAHQLLLAEIPDPNQRNQTVWQASESFFGEPERNRAEQAFPVEQFEHRRDICLWFEHEVAGTATDGTPTVRKNDVNRIKAIVQENNSRIADTDAYSAIVDKHTTPANQAVPKGHDPPPPPRTIGFAGPYRIGMIGRIQPKFALFADEHRRRDEAATFRDRPRRSVEVLTLRANGKSYIDPIAALSEAPRLPLPVQYAPGSQDGIVERYQLEAVYADAERYEGAYAGGSNTYLPGSGFAGNKNPDQFDALSGDQNQQPESGSMMTPEDLKQIVEAVQSTPQFQFLNQLMQGQGGQPADPNGGDPNATQQPPAAPQAPPQAPAAQPVKEPYIAPLAAAGMMAGAGAMTNRFSADSPEHQTEVEVNEPTVTNEQYAALSQNVESLMRENAALKQGYAELRMSAADSNRKLQISELHNQFPSFVDPVAEESRCLYSAGSQMSDEEFDRHIEMVESYAARVPAVTQMVPAGVMPGRLQDRSVETEKYEADLAEAAIEVFTQAQAAGERLTYEQAREKAKSRIAG